MPVSRACVVRGGDNPIPHFGRSRIKFRSGILWRGDRFQQGLTIEGIKMVKENNRQGQSIAHLRRRHRTLHADDRVQYSRVSRRTEGLNQKPDIPGILCNDQISINVRNPHHPTKLARKVEIVPIGKHFAKRLAVRFSCGAGASQRLRKFLFYRNGGKTGLDSADGVNVSPPLGGGQSRNCLLGRRLLSRHLVGRTAIRTNRGQLVSGQRRSDSARDFCWKVVDDIQMHDSKLCIDLGIKI